MAEAQRYPFALAANGVANIACTGSRFNILTATGALNVRLDIGGEYKAIVAGQGHHAGDDSKRFYTLTLTDVSGAPNVGFIQVADDDFVSNVLSGAVTVTNAITVANTETPTLTAPAHTNPVPGVASANLLAANANRQYLLVQNNDTVLDLFINIGGAPATAATGIKIGPGDSFEPGAVSVTAITAISPGGNNNNVVVVEG